MLGQEAVADKSKELSAIPVLLERLAADGGLKGAVVTIDAIACNATIANSIRAAGADYRLAVKGNQPTLRDEIEAFFSQASEAELDHFREVDKGLGRIEEREVTVTLGVNWLDGDRRFPGELRLPDVASIIKVTSQTQLKCSARSDARYFISSAKAGAKRVAEIIRGHWRIENQLHWTLDVVYNEDQSRLRKGHGAKNMAVVRHFAINLTRQAPEDIRPQRSGLRRKTNKPPAPKRTSIKLRRKIAGWNLNYLAAILNVHAR